MTNYADGQIEDQAGTIECHAGLGHETRIKTAAMLRSLLAERQAAKAGVVTDEVVERIAKLFQDSQAQLSIPRLGLKIMNWDDCSPEWRAEHICRMRAALASVWPTAGWDGWIEGAPKYPWSDEWFIAKLDNGDKVVLRSLPDEYAYDFRTADETYLMAFRIKQWMQFPDSQFIAAAEGEKK